MVGIGRNERGDEWKDREGDRNAPDKKDAMHLPLAFSTCLSVYSVKDVSLP